MNSFVKLTISLLILLLFWGCESNSNVPSKPSVSAEINQEKINQEKNKHAAHLKSNDELGKSIETIRQNILNHDNGMISVVAHRACWQNAPENTLLAIENCIKSGVDIIEIDVRRTKDGHLVLLHDKTLDRTTNGSGRLNSHTLADVKALNVVSNNEEVTSLKIPTLDEVLDFTRGKLILNLDIKDDDVAQQAFNQVADKKMGKQILVKLREAPDSARLRNYKLPEGALFMPIIFQCGHKWKGACARKLSKVVKKYEKYKPVAFEVVFNDIKFLNEGIQAIHDIDAKVWVNTLSPILSANHDDMKALEKPDENWGAIYRNGR